MDHDKAVGNQGDTVRAIIKRAQEEWAALVTGALAADKKAFLVLLD